MLIRFISGIKFVIYKAFNKISSYGDWEVTLKIYFGNTNTGSRLLNWNQYYLYL